MLVCWMIWYYYCFPSGFKCAIQLYSSAFSLSKYRYYVTLCIGKEHPIAVYKTVFLGVRALVLSVIRWSCYYFLDRILFHHAFHHESCDYYCNFYGHSLLFELHLKLYVTGSAYAQIPRCFRLLDILLEYWIEHVTLGLLYVMFTFSTTILYRGLPGFAADCPWGVWCRGLTTCLLYVGPLFGNLVWNDSSFVSLT